MSEQVSQQVSGQVSQSVSQSVSEQVSEWASVHIQRSPVSSLSPLNTSCRKQHTTRLSSKNFSENPVEVQARRDAGVGECIAAKLDYWIIELLE